MKTTKTVYYRPYKTRSGMDIARAGSCCKDFRYNILRRNEIYQVGYGSFKADDVNVSLRVVIAI